MRIYQGDTYTFSCTVPATAGTVTTAPLITIFAASTLTPVVTSQAMPIVPGSERLYLYRWMAPTTAAEDDYIAIVSYVASSLTETGLFLEKVHVGGVGLPGVVALDETGVKDATVAKDAPVAHQTDIAGITPATNATIQGILTKVTALPADPASNRSEVRR